MDSAIHWVSYYPLFSAIGYHNTYPLDSDLSGGAFEQLQPDLYCLKHLLVSKLIKVAANSEEVTFTIFLLYCFTQANPVSGCKNGVSKCKVLEISR